jgi:23S rRNA (uracil1939-C5)-methyltransferase
MTKEIEVKKVNPLGYAVIDFDNKTYLVPNLLMGEKAILELTKRGLQIVKRTTSSPDRVKPVCPIYDQCGGCQLQHLSYQNQLKLKHEQVVHFLAQEKLNYPVLPVIGSANPLNYRNKIQMVYGIHKQKIVAGFYEENTHKIVNAHDCDIQDKISNQIINTIKVLMKKHKLLPYDEDKDEGIIRHVMIKRSEATKEILVIIVTPSSFFPGRNNLLKDLLKAHPEITSVVHNFNPRQTSVVLGDQEKTLFGKGYIEDILLNKRFVIGSKTFYQINSKQTEVLYNKVIEFLEPTKNDTILDAYAGIGTIGIILSSYVKQVVAVEINKDSVLNARKNASLNQVSNFRIEATDAKDYIQFLQDNQINLDAIVVDPPRAGLELPFIESIMGIKPKKVIYVSCNPETLARDLRQLSKLYNVDKIQPVDMFSQTYHVENVCLLTLK